MTNLISVSGSVSAGVAASEERSFDTKRDLGKSLVRKLKRVRAQLIAARKLRLPARQRLADKLWNQFLASTSFPSEKVVPAAISGTGTAVCDSWWELKYWSFIVSCFEQHQVYEELLAGYDEVRPLPSAQKGMQVWFFGSGHGRSTLNTYRSIRKVPERRGEDWQFEKVYSRQDDDFFRMASMELCAGAHLRSQGIFFPPVLDTISGQRVALVYSVFAKGRRLDANTELERGDMVVKALMASPVDESRLDSVLYRYHPNFIDALSRAREWVRRNKPEFSCAFEEIALDIEEQYPRCLAHGDLHRKNMLNSGAVLDWDNCGVYPVGFDPGMMAARSLGKHGLDELESALRRYFLAGTDNATNFHLKHGALFYAFVFGAGKAPLANDSLLVALLERVVKQAERGRP
ncbi:MAG: phosphotransferase [Pseudomonadota bacterium]